MKLRDPQTTLEMAKRQVVENGFYIPLYDFDTDALLFTPEDFDRYQQEWNQRVQVPVWEYSFRVGDAKGSHKPAGEYALPTEAGELKRYYVKFANYDFPAGESHVVEREQEEQSRIWNEYLADSIYKHMGIAVPETAVVKVNRTVGHASAEVSTNIERSASDFGPNARGVARVSEMVRVEESSEEARLTTKDGFLVDAMLGNWDIALEKNLVFSGGKALRVDNGGALLYRTREGRKTNFGQPVFELETMKGSYEGLTRADVQTQLGVLAERFTNDAIDQLVDSVRLNSTDRTVLKNVLRQRRDYVLTYYDQTEEIVAAEISQDGKLVQSALTAETFEDGAIAQVLPEWVKLVGEEGYQHNGILLGDHIKGAVSTLKSLPEYASLSDKEKSLALTAALFHDIGKPTGQKGTDVPRDYTHEIPSAQMAGEYMTKWGYSKGDIKTVIQVIVNDGIASDIARGGVRDERKNLSPQQLKALADSPSALKILRAVNRADVIATVGQEGFDVIASEYNQYFDQALS